MEVDDQAMPDLQSPRDGNHLEECGFSGDRLAMTGSRSTTPYAEPDSATEAFKRSVGIYHA